MAESRHLVAWTAVAAFTGIAAFAWNVAVTINPDLPDHVRSLARETRGVSAEDLRIGDCANFAGLPAAEDWEPDSMTPRRYDLVPCARPHHFQVVWTQALTTNEETDYEVSGDLIGRVCKGRSRAFAPGGLVEGLQETSLSPNGAAWRDNYRTAVCIVGAPDLGRVVGGFSVQE